MGPLARGISTILTPPCLYQGEPKLGLIWGKLPQSQGVYVQSCPSGSLGFNGVNAFWGGRGILCLSLLTF